jgi:hypothetical protein
MPRRAKRFKVVGIQPILEHLPGESFEASLPKDQEEFLISIGGLEEVKEKAKGKGDGSPDRK